MGSCASLWNPWNPVQNEGRALIAPNSIITGWCFGTWLDYFHSWDDDPIWRTPSFFRGVGIPPISYSIPIVYGDNFPKATKKVPMFRHPGFLVSGCSGNKKYDFPSWTTRILGNTKSMGTTSCMDGSNPFFTATGAASRRLCGASRSMDINIILMTSMILMVKGTWLIINYFDG